jgi:hypothetical protein
VVAGEKLHGWPRDMIGNNAPSGSAFRWIMHGPALERAANSWA